MKTTTTSKKTTTKPASKPRAATKPAQATKPAHKAVGAFASVYDALKACGITNKPNFKGHHDNGRFSTAGIMSAKGKSYFAARLPDEQKTLSGYMAKAKQDGFKTPDGFVFAPVVGGPVSHAPVNPGSYNKPIIRAWFSLLVASVK